MSTNTDDAEKVVVRQSDNYGSRHSRLPGVDGAAVSIETPEVIGEEPISVSGYAYDDRDEGQVELTLGGDVRVSVTVDATAARALADLDASERERDILASGGKLSWVKQQHEGGSDAAPADD